MPERSAQGRMHGFALLRHMLGSPRHLAVMIALMVALMVAAMSVLH